jgi:hypothetical protein
VDGLLTRIEVEKLSPRLFSNHGFFVSGTGDSIKTLAFLATVEK